MGSTQSSVVHDDGDGDDDSHWYVCTSWPWQSASRRPIRVSSAVHAITEWEPIGDKNAEYYGGSRFFRADHGDSVDYAKSICDTTPNRSWWVPWSSPSSSPSPPSSSS